MWWVIHELSCTPGDVCTAGLLLHNHLRDHDGVSCPRAGNAYISPSAKLHYSSEYQILTSRPLLLVSQSLPISRICVSEESMNAHDCHSGEAICLEAGFHSPLASFLYPVGFPYVYGSYMYPRVCVKGRHCHKVLVLWWWYSKSQIYIDVFMRYEFSNDYLMARISSACRSIFFKQQNSILSPYIVSAMVGLWEFPHSATR